MTRPLKADRLSAPPRCQLRTCRLPNVTRFASGQDDFPFRLCTTHTTTSPDPIRLEAAQPDYPRLPRSSQVVLTSLSTSLPGIPSRLPAPLRLATSRPDCPPSTPTRSLRLPTAIPSSPHNDKTHLIASLPPGSTTRPSVSPTLYDFPRRHVPVQGESIRLPVSAPCVTRQPDNPTQCCAHSNLGYPYRLPALTRPSSSSYRLLSSCPRLLVSSRHPWTNRPSSPSRRQTGSIRVQAPRFDKASPHNSFRHVHSPSAPFQIFPTGLVNSNLPGTTSRLGACLSFPIRQAKSERCTASLPDLTSHGATLPFRPCSTCRSNLHQPKLTSLVLSSRPTTRQPDNPCPIPSARCDLTTPVISLPHISTSLAGSTPLLSTNLSRTVRLSTTNLPGATTLLFDYSCLSRFSRLASTCRIDLLPLYSTFLPGCQLTTTLTTIRVSSDQFLTTTHPRPTTTPMTIHILSHLNHSLD